MNGSDRVIVLATASLSSLGGLGAFAQSTSAPLRAVRAERGDIQPATAAHIHAGESGEIGPPVVKLEPPVDGSSEGCTEADRDLIHAIRSRPADYYVNVHNAEFPAGAVRGQLEQ